MTETPMDATFPADRLALSILTVNPFLPGDRFDEDGWVYDSVTGAKRRKWFVRMEGIPRLWEPKLDRIAHLESRRWFFLNRAKEKLTPLWNSVTEKMKAVGVFAGYRDPMDPKKAKGWIEFWDYVKSEGVCWDWSKLSDKKPENIPINQALTDEWFAYNDAKRHFYKPFWFYQAVFQRSVNRKYSGQERNVTLHLKINGRDYWFRKSERGLERIAFPENTNFVEEVL